jgi:hypothetical protein
MTVEESLRLSVFLSKDKDVKDPVKNTLKEGMRALNESKKYNEIARLMRFAEELGEKFLSTLGEQRFKTEDPFKLLQLLQTERPDWKEIMKRFNKAKSYKVKPHTGDKPAMIVFKYADGKIEKYSLEWTGGQKIEFAEAVTSPLRRKKAGKGKDELSEKIRQILAEKPDRQIDIDEDDEKPSDKDKQSREKFRQQLEEIRERSKNLKTPSDVKDYISNNTQHLSEGLVDELSGPLAQLAGILGKMNINHQGFEFENDNDMSTYIKVIKQIGNILKRHYPEGIGAIAKSEEKKELQKILGELAPEF